MAAGDFSSSHFAVRAEAGSSVYSHEQMMRGMVSEEGGPATLPKPSQDSVETLKVQLMGPNDIRSEGKSKLVLPLKEMISIFVVLQNFNSYSEISPLYYLVQFVLFCS